MTYIENVLVCIAAPLFITMLCIEMKSSGMKKINLAPTLEQLPQATDFFEGILAEAGASMKAIAQVNVAVDEIFSNIARYSGHTDRAGC